MPRAVPVSAVRVGGKGAGGLSARGCSVRLVQDGVSITDDISRLTFLADLKAETGFIHGHPAFSASGTIRKPTSVAPFTSCTKLQPRFFARHFGETRGARLGTTCAAADFYKACANSSDWDFRTVPVRSCCGA